MPGLPIIWMCVYKIKNFISHLASLEQTALTKVVEVTILCKTILKISVANLPGGINA
jgi:hypothetical protein